MKASYEHARRIQELTEEGEGRLFDRAADARERVDLWANASFAAVRSALLVALLRWRAQQDDLQYELANWNGAATVGLRARNDSQYLDGNRAERNLQLAAAAADAIVIA